MENNGELDRTIDSALAGYSGVEPLAGIEERVLVSGSGGGSWAAQGARVGCCDCGCGVSGDSSDHCAGAAYFGTEDLYRGSTGGDASRAGGAEAASRDEAAGEVTPIPAKASAKAGTVSGSSTHHLRGARLVDACTGAPGTGAGDLRRTAKERRTA